MENIDTIFFDVNETLLDLSPLKESINKALGNDKAADIWFAQLLHYSLVTNHIDSYSDFSKIAAAVFKMNAQANNKQFSEDEVKSILSPVSKLKAYPEVTEVLKDLKEQGFTLVAFSNGKPDVLNDQLEYAGISALFDEVLSVEECEKFKPHPTSYEHALKMTNSNAENSLMVAAHGWDIAGANSVGIQTAFIERKGKSLFPLAEKPTWKLKNLTGLLDI
jgi:2-haloacid dehalogenase